MSKEQLSTSETIKTEVPKHINALEEKYKNEPKLPPAKEPLSPENIGTETVDKLPEPTGWRLLVFTIYTTYKK